MNDDWKLPWEGGCRCGQVRLRISARPVIAMACHCAGCRKMSASAFSLTMMVPASGFEVTAGETAPGGLQQALDHRFCPFCKTWMFTRADPTGQFVNLRPTTLDDHGWVVPFVECCVTEKLSWASTLARYAYDQFPPAEDRPSLLAEFAEQGARPGRQGPEGTAGWGKHTPP
jgi:hypothetical protein